MSNKIPRQDIIDDINRVIKETKSTSLKTYKEKGKYSEGAVIRCIGMKWNEYISSLGYRPSKRFNVKKSEVIKDVERTFEKTGSTKQEDYIDNGKFSRAVIKRLFGSWNKMLKELNIPLNMYKPGQYSKDDIINDYKRVEENFGRTLSASEYRKYGKYSQPIVDNVFGSFTNLKRELGEIIDARFVSNEEIEQDLMNLHQTYGILSGSLITEESIVSYPTIIARYGNLENLCKKMNIPYSTEENKSKLLIQCLTNVKKILGPDCTLEKTFPWLKNPKTNKHLFVDIFFEKRKLAIEVDGGQHYKVCEQFAPTEKALKRIQARDKAKDTILKEHGYQIIRLTKPSFKYIEESLKDVI
jgi:hypothetical protein